jgi:kynureninase
LLSRTLPWFTSTETRSGEDSETKVGLIIGSKPGETIVCDSTSINLFKLAWGLMGQRGNRTKIITDRANFPTDLYILESVAKLSNADIQIELVDFDDATHQGVDEKLAERIDDSTALVCLSHVQYKSGYAFDMQSVTQKCRSRGVRTLWDLSHSVGVLPMQLADWGVDAAVGYRLATPRDASMRGSHVSVSHPQGWQITQTKNRSV